MFQRGRQSSYGGVDSSSDQHILTVLRFHEVRLGKIEKHLINTNNQLERLINQKQQIPIKVSTKTANTESFTLLKNMMTNLTEQVAVSQSFMKEIKEVIGNLKHHKVEEVANKKVPNSVTTEEAAEISEDEDSELILLEPLPIVDDTVLENDIIKLTNFKSHVEEEVQEVLDKIPIIKPKKKRRGKTKKGIIA